MRSDENSEVNYSSDRPIRKFEDLIAWQHARKLTSLIYNTTSQGNFSKDFGLKDQIRRAAVSIMSNIAEGYERNSKRDLANFLRFARGSCAELRTQLYIGQDIGLIEEEIATHLQKEALELSKMLQGLINRYKTSETT